MARTKYTPERGWTRDVSAQLQSGPAADAARAVQAFAEADDRHGRYTARPAVVTAGQSNEARAGYVVEEQERSWSGVHKRTLVRASQQAGGGR